MSRASFRFACLCWAYSELDVVTVAFDSPVSTGSKAAVHLTYMLDGESFTEEFALN